MSTSPLKREGESRRSEISSMTYGNQNIIIPEVSSLEMIGLDDSVPHIQFESQCIEVDLASQYNPVGFLDAKGYDTPYNEECLLAGKLESCIERGENLVSFMYSCRSISKAIPDLTNEIENSTSDEFILKKNEINRRIIEIIRPNILRLLELAAYVVEASNYIFQFYSTLSSLQQTDPQPSDNIFVLYITVLDILIKLENLKERKAAYQYDFARYRRALGTQLSPEDIEEINQLVTFLVNPDPRKTKNYIFHLLQDQIKRVNGFEDISIYLIDTCLKYFESEVYILPDEMFRFIRPIPYLVAIMDGPPDDVKNNVFLHKKLRISVLQKLFRKMPVVPIYGDMCLTLIAPLELAGHFNRTTMGASWADMSDTKVVPPEYRLLTHWKGMREEHVRLGVQLTSLMNKLDYKPFTKTLDQKNIEIANQAYDVVFNCFKALGRWNIVLNQSLAWKYTHPSIPKVSDKKVSGIRKFTMSAMSPRETASAGGTTRTPNDSEGQEYDLALRANLTREDLSILVDAVSMIKSLSSLLLRSEATLAPILRFHIHHNIQQLVQGDLLPLLHRVDKRNRLPDLTALLQLRTTAADWLTGVEPSPNSDYKGYSRKMGTQIAKHPPRVVGSTPTQLYLLRAYLKHVSNENAPLRQKKGMLSSAEMEKEDVKVFETFHSESYYYPHILNFHHTVRSLCDLSEMWYRETFLEITGCVQFPIEMSLPWILAEHTVSSKETDAEATLIETLLLVLDLYNDSAQRALYEFNQQYLYDEVEAEANLVLDQVIYLLSEEAYSHHRAVAAAASIDKSLKHKLEELKGHPHLTISDRRYDIAVIQRHARLLGRSINFTYLIGQHVSSKFARDVETLVKKFESCPVEAGLIEFRNGFLMLLRLHRTLSDLFELDSFDTIFSQIDECAPSTSYRGRIAVHILRSITGDLVPNSSYNYHTQRFVKSPIAIRPIEYGRPPKGTALSLLYGHSALKAFEMTSRTTKGFFGRIHLQVLLELSAYYDLSALIVECLGYLTVKIKDIADYVDALREGIAPTKLPKYLFRAGGCYGFFEGKLRSILEYDDLKPEIFQAFREAGNTIAFLRDLSDLVDVSDQTRFINLAPYLGKNVFESKEEFIPSEENLNLVTLANLLTSLADNVTKNPELAISPTLSYNLQEAARRLSTTCASSTGYNSIFHFTLKQVQDTMAHFQLDKKWASAKLHYNDFQANPYIAVEIEQASGFHKIWSALNFLFCMPDGDELKVEKARGIITADDGEFGHGFAIAGCLFVHLMGQRYPFELMDYANHVLNVDAHDKTVNTISTSGSLKGLGQQVGQVDPSLQKATDKFLVTAAEQRQLHSELFVMYQAKIPVKFEITGFSKDVAAHGIVLYHPPAEVIES